MTRTMYDSVNPGHIPTNATMVAGYADGTYANIPAMKARFPHATIVSIAVKWTTRAQVLDVESGNASPAQAVQWCTQTMADKSNHELTVYCSVSDWPQVRAAFKTAGVTEPNYWVAAYDGNATVPAGAIAKQYLGDYQGYDKSVVADHWPGVDSAPAPSPQPSGAETYPGASKAHGYSSAYPGDPMQVNTIVWHSTETSVLPDYSGGSIAPTLTAVPDFAGQKLVWYQHFGFDESARALVHDKAQIGTNTLNCAQVEIVGTCDPTTHAAWSKAGTQHLYMPELPDWAIRDLNAFAHWAHDAHGVPLTSGLTWKPYPASYGSNGVRMDTAAWSAFNGHCGHQHVPENDHGDPGQFPIAQILEADMPLTDADVLKFWQYSHGDTPDVHQTLATAAEEATAAAAQATAAATQATAAAAGVKGLATKVDGLASLALTDTQITALAAQLATSSGLVDAIAEKVAENIAARLAQ